jgi:hypothetical protein
LEPTSNPVGRNAINAFVTVTDASQATRSLNESEHMVTDISLPPDARVGIYWGIIGPAEDLELITDMTNLSEAEQYGDFLTHPRGHYDVWEAWRQSGPRWLAKLTLPKLITWTEYETLPRGRVVYNAAAKHFIIYADRRLQRSSFIKKIVDSFGLNSTAFSVMSDAHYSERA